MKLSQKTAIITGAARGIGKSIAMKFAQEGCALHLVDVNLEGVQKLAAQLAKDFSIKTYASQADISKQSDVAKMVEGTLKNLPGLDILINNAGILRDATLLKMSEEQFDQVIAVNLRGVFLCGQACAKVMAEKKHGKIVNISSVAARGNFGQTNYSATKAGVIGMTKTWALELSKYNINVNAIAPGLIATEMTQTIPQEIREKMTAMVPLARMGLPEEIADLACFLSSQDSSYIQGEVININGGFLM